MAFPHYVTEHNSQSMSPLRLESEDPTPSSEKLCTPVDAVRTPRMVPPGAPRPTKRMRDEFSMSLSIPDPPTSSADVLSTPVDAPRGAFSGAPPAAPRALRPTKRLRDAFAVPASQSSGPTMSQGLLPDMSQDTLALFPRIIRTHVRRSRPSTIAKAALISTLNRATALRNPFERADTRVDVMRRMMPPASAIPEDDVPEVGREAQREALKKLLVCTSQPRKFSLDFEELGVAGEGDFSQVIKARSRIDGVTYAVKRNKKAFTFAEMKLDALNEVFALATLQDHPSILRYYNAWFEHNGHTLFIQTAFLTGGNVYDNYVDDGRKMGVDQLVSLIRHIGGAMEFMHRKGVLHHDIKPDNIFEQVDEDGVHRYVLGDFGLATRADGAASVEGDSRYLCPEALNSEWKPGNETRADDSDSMLIDARNPRKRARTDAPRTAADVFSFGASVYELAVGVPLPKSGDTWLRLRTDNHSAAADVLDACGSHAIAEIVRHSLVADPQARASCRRILQLLDQDESSAGQVKKLRKENAKLCKHLKETRAALARLLNTGTKIDKPARRSSRVVKTTQASSRPSSKPTRRSSRRSANGSAKR